MEYVVCNKSTSIFIDKDKSLTYFDLLASLIEKVPAQGLTIAEMKKEFDLLEKMKSNKEEALLDENEYVHLLNYLNETKWTIKNKDLQFDVESAIIAFRAVNREHQLSSFTATHYHAVHVRPVWAKKLKRLTKIGNHIFYEER